MGLEEHAKLQTLGPAYSLWCWLPPATAKSSLDKRVVPMWATAHRLPRARSSSCGRVLEWPNAPLNVGSWGGSRRRKGTHTSFRCSVATCRRVLLETARSCMAELSSYVDFIGKGVSLFSLLTSCSSQMGICNIHRNTYNMLREWWYSVTTT